MDVYYALHTLQYDDKVAQAGTFVVDLDAETASFFLKNDAIRPATDAERETVESVHPAFIVERAAKAEAERLAAEAAAKSKSKSAAKSDDI